MILTKELIEGKVGMPWEVIELIGQERLERLGDNFPSKTLSALQTLKRWHDTKGIDWIRNNQIPLQDMLVELEEM